MINYLLNTVITLRFVHYSNRSPHKPFLRAALPHCFNTTLLSLQPVRRFHSSLNKQGSNFGLDFIKGSYMACLSQSIHLQATCLFIAYSSHHTLVELPTLANKKSFLLLQAISTWATERNAGRVALHCSQPIKTQLWESVESLSVNKQKDTLLSTLA